MWSQQRAMSDTGKKEVDGVSLIPLAAVRGHVAAAWFSSEKTGHPEDWEQMSVVIKEEPLFHFLSICTSLAKEPQLRQ